MATRPHPVGLVRSLGFDRFDLMARDRGARVAHRLALDHPNTVQRTVLLNIAHTLAMHEQTSERLPAPEGTGFF